MIGGRQAAVLAGSVLCLCLVALGDQPAASMPADHVQAILQAKDISAAEDALAEAQKIKTDDIKALEAYLRRAVMLGRPQKALSATELLARLRQDHALAQGLLGYCLALRGTHMNAATATLKAAAIAPENSGVLFNVGVLSTWLAADAKSAPLSLAATQSLKENLPQWQSRAGFSEGVEAANRIFAQRAVRIDQAKDRLEKAQKKLKELSEPKGPLGAKGARRGKGAADPLKAALDKNRKSRQAAEKQMAAASQAVKKIRASVPANADKATVDKAVQGILKHQQTYVQAQKNRAEAAARVNELEARIARQQAPLLAAKAVVETARKQIDRVRAAVPVLEWRPPTIDGQEFPDRDRSGSSGEGEQTSSDAASRLEIAKALIRNNRYEAAIRILGEVADQDRNPQAAKEAQALLDEIAAEQEEP